MNLDTSVILTRRMRVVPLELYPYRILCPRPGCPWSCPAQDVDDAVQVLSDHLTAEHQWTVPPCAN